MNEQESTDGYEFSAGQNSVFSGLAGAMKFVGIVSAVLGALTLAPVFVQPVALLINGPQAALLIAIGIWTTRASNSIRAIVDTQGNDINHLMAAMEGLSRLYRLQRAMMILAMVAVIIVILVLVTTGGAILAELSQAAS